VSAPAGLTRGPDAREAGAAGWRAAPWRPGLLGGRPLAAKVLDDRRELGIGHHRERRGLGVLTGTQHLTLVPAPGRLSSDHDPPRASLRSRIELSPTWPAGE